LRSLSTPPMVWTPQAVKTTLRTHWSCQTHGVQPAPAVVSFQNHQREPTWKAMVDLHQASSETPKRVLPVEERAIRRGRGEQFEIGTRGKVDAANFVGARTEEHDHEAETDHAGEEAAGGGGIAESREVGELAEAVGTPEPARRVEEGSARQRNKVVTKVFFKKRRNARDRRFAMTCRAKRTYMSGSNIMVKAYSPKYGTIASE